MAVVGIPERQEAAREVGLDRLESPPPLRRPAGAAARYLSMTEATSCGNSFISKAE